jgi:hypothetical protein
MVLSTDSIWDEFSDHFVQEYEDVVVYGDADGTEILHEGALRIIPNGWVELPTGRVLSPTAVHHIDPVTASSD